jgi:hypothetical protein
MHLTLNIVIVDTRYGKQINPQARDVNVAFTREYSKVSNFHEKREVD